MQINKMLLSLALLLTLFGLVSAAGETAAIGAGICSLFTLINTVLTAVIFLLIVAAAVVYAGGQLLGAETRARATVWATSMFIGALIGVLIYVIAPMVLGAMMGAPDASVAGMQAICNGGTGGSGGSEASIIPDRGGQPDATTIPAKCGTGCTGSPGHCICIR